MTEVIVETQQLQLVNIVEVVQSKLVKNFAIILKKLKKTDQSIIEHSQIAQRNLQLTNQTLQRLQQLILLQEKSHAEVVEQLKRRIISLQEANQTTVTERQKSSFGLRRINDELFNTQLQFQEKIKIKQSQVEEINRNIVILGGEQTRFNQQINKKENKVEAQKVIKETQMLKDKNKYFQNQIKVIHHKIQKIEILNQKAERLQAKKEVQIIKEIEERVKKEIKLNAGTNLPVGSVSGQDGSFSCIQNSLLGATGGSSNNVGNISKFFTKKDSKQQEEQGQYKRPSILQDENRRNSVSLTSIAGESLFLNNIETIVQKWGEKIKYFESQLKEITQNLKVLNRNGANKKTEVNKENNTDGIKDKINQIKPQVVKLWAKLDTLEDRMGFNQRKIEEKMKNVNDLTLVIKENNLSKIEDKLKTLQTEVFTSLKEIKSKLETKVGQIEYEKYRQQFQDKISQINEMIYLKSEKLEVKKALLFLQSKIKEIILVISEDQQNQKDALLTKKQLKCISCDKQLEKFSGFASSPKSNWDNMPFKDHPPQILGRFGMTNFGSLAKKIKKLEGKDLPLLNKKSINQSLLNST